MVKVTFLIAFLIAQCLLTFVHIDIYIDVHLLSMKLLVTEGQPIKPNFLKNQLVD